VNELLLLGNFIEITNELLLLLGNGKIYGTNSWGSAMRIGGYLCGNLACNLRLVARISSN
jgi:hypothetical protein